MYSLNRIDLIGNVGQDPELKFTAAGTPFTRLSLATNERWRDQSDQLQQHTEWHTVTFWGQQAELAQKYVKKGSFISVEGQLRSREYERDGVKRRVWEVRGQRLGLLDQRGRNQAEAAAPMPAGEAGAAPGTDDDVPL